MSSVFGTLYINNNGADVCSFAYFRFYYDVPPTIHQLQAAVCWSYAVETNDLQIPQRYNG
jgi:hypothetical protein